MHIPEDIIDRIFVLRDAYFENTLQGALKRHPDLITLKVCYNNGALEMYAYLKSTGRLKDEEQTAT